MNRSSSPECDSSNISRYASVLNSALASSNETPCFLRFVRLLAASQTNLTNQAYAADLLSQRLMVAPGEAFRRRLTFRGSIGPQAIRTNGREQNLGDLPSAIQAEGEIRKRKAIGV